MRVVVISREDVAAEAGEEDGVVAEGAAEEEDIRVYPIQQPYHNPEDMEAMDQDRVDSTNNNDL
jgi:hypothetical protein